MNLLKTEIDDIDALKVR